MALKFDVVVVGAGPAGAVAAAVAARAGLRVALVERGERPGTKNMFGGVVHTSPLSELLPNWWDDAPIERRLVRRAITMLSSSSAVTVELSGAELGRLPYLSYIVNRSKFDAWLADEAVEAGAKLLTGVTVAGVLRNGAGVSGVTTRREDGEIDANVVIAADGANSLLSEAAGLRREFRPKEFSLGVKEVLSLSDGVIEERFGLAGDEGAAHEFMGQCTRGLPGGGFLYTNRSGLALGVVVNLAALSESRVTPYELLDGFKEHPEVAKLIRGSVPREYSAHLVPEDGWNMMPRPFTDGMMIVGDAAGFVLATGLALQGVNLAVASGLAAGRAAVIAHEAGDFSSRRLSVYSKLLDEYGLLPSLKSFRRAPRLLSNRRLYSVYPELAAAVARGLLANNGEPAPRLLRLLRHEIRQHGGVLPLARDALDGMVSL